MNRETSLIHGTLIAIANQGLLLKGASGSGKSDLALRLITQDLSKIISDTPILVSDDQVELFQENNKLFGRAPKPLQGMLEVRNIGILKFPFLTKTQISLCVELTKREKIDRLPKEKATLSKLVDIELPTIQIDPFDQTAPQKCLLALTTLDNDQ